MTRDHFLINQPEFTKKVTRQTGLGFSTTGCYRVVIRNSRKRVKIIPNLRILLVEKSINDLDKLSVADG